jgi:elongation factor P--beta-lysine ligase
VGIDWSEVWKLGLVILPPIAGVVKSWRNQWQGPRHALDFWDSWREPRIALYHVTRERNYLRRQVLNQSHQLDELMQYVSEQADFASYVDSYEKSQRSSDADREPTDLNPRRIPSPSTRPRLRKRKRNSPTPTAS